jgi:hypothetical protein
VNRKVTFIPGGMATAQSGKFMVLQRGEKQDDSSGSALLCGKL